MSNGQTSVTRYGRALDFRSIIKPVIRLLRFIGFARLVKFVNLMVRKISYTTHWVQYVLEFGAEPKCDWYDHFIDVHYDWPRSRLPMAWERGIFNLLALRPGGRLLELCCGDGFNAAFFYSAKSSEITSIDRCSAAIAHARLHHSSDRIRYIQGDIKTDIPQERYDNVVWDSAICMFSHDEIDQVMRIIKDQLEGSGILSGHIGFEADHTDMNVTRYETIDALQIRLDPYFRNVRIFSTTYGSRYNLYFYASDAQLPFDPDWPESVRTSRNGGMSETSAAETIQGADG